MNKPTRERAIENLMSLHCKLHHSGEKHSTQEPKA